MQIPRVVTSLVAAMLLAGCSLFAPEKPEGSTPVTVEEGSGSQSEVTETQQQDDVDSCREQARAVVRQDENISADIQSRDAQGAFWDDSPELTQNMDAYESQQRYHRIFEECMRGRGYVDQPK